MIFLGRSPSAARAGADIVRDWSRKGGREGRLGGALRVANPGGRGAHGVSSRVRNTAAMVGPLLPTAFAATDASSKGYGHVIFEMDGSISGRPGQEYLSPDDHRHIFLKELQAAFDGVRIAVAQGRQRVRLITDVAVGCFTRSSEGMAMIVESTGAHR